MAGFINYLANNGYNRKGKIMSTAKHWQPIGLFATPKNMKALQDHAANFSAGEGVAANVLLGMTWNLCCQMHNDSLETEEPERVQLGSWWNKDEGMTIFMRLNDDLINGNFSDFKSLATTLTNYDLVSLHQGILCKKSTYREAVGDIILSRMAGE